MTALRVLSLATVCALLTWFVGWWAVPVMSLVAGALWRRSDAARLVALSAAIGWVVLLAVDAYGGALGSVATVVGGVFGAPALVMLGFTLLFVSVGAWSAAALGAELAQRVLQSRRVEIARAPSQNG